MSPKVSKEHLEKRRAKILDAATDVFIQNGYEKTTMKDIMDAANISRGGLYQYFSNKEDVFEALLKEDLDDELEETEDLLKDKTDTYWELLLLRMFGDSRQPNDEMDPLSPSKLEFFITGRNDEHRRSYGVDRYYSGLKLYSEVIKAGQQSGEFSSKYDSELLARTISTYIDGLSLHHAILPLEAFILKEQSTMFVEYLKMALGVKE